ncbi:ABC transporter ATP-binding protein [Rhizobium terrae]|uniref:ABC transporter ATP-binding protein n=1 Tax=Rhizobium terrae TaxID=2171756 RepID=UPI001D034299|nr:ABC transporter ATP-binding protein [Rhizobium terrae]
MNESLRKQNIGKPAGLTGMSVLMQNVSKSYGSFEAIKNVSLDVKGGEFISLLGPSGSGKTTLLMMLAGFEVPNGGSIRIGDRDITNLPPNKREIAMVFQKYALFPHLSVRQNIAFPLEMRGVAKDIQSKKIQEALTLVKLNGYEERKPHELSGGQAQRVALARAIVFDPRVILMDEPLGALDRNLRQHMQVELKQLQQRLGSTVVYVTHDQEEALTMSDRIAVMDKGRIAQIGSPQDLYHRPENVFVGKFIGEMTLLSGTISHADDASTIIDLGGGEKISCRAFEQRFTVGEKAVLGVRPEDLSISRSAQPLKEVSGTVVHVRYNGSASLVSLEHTSGAVILVAIPERERGTAPQVGSTVVISIDTGNIHLFKYEQ